MPWMVKLVAAVAMMNELRIDGAPNSAELSKKISQRICPGMIWEGVEVSSIGGRVWGT